MVSRVTAGTEPPDAAVQGHPRFEQSGLTSASTRRGGLPIQFLKRITQLEKSNCSYKLNYCDNR